ncbi:MAG: hypothetical protein KIS88_01125 [Anaerolineales bacterium]|nr:hypothetical protein [Anaerolineales bacterium]
MHIELSDAAGRLLARQILKFAGGELQLTVPFEISRPPLPARLTARTLDAYGRVQALRSVELVLLAEGDASLLPASAEPALHIEQPAAGQSVPSGELTIRGIAYGTAQPLSLQLITREGRILVARDVYLHDARDGKARFETTLTLTLQEPTWLQIAVTAFGRQVPGASSFDGIEVLVLP